jgi:hypothetical protein
VNSAGDVLEGRVSIIASVNLPPLFFKHFLRYCSDRLIIFDMENSYTWGDIQFDGTVDGVPTSTVFGWSMMQLNRMNAPNRHGY